MKTSKKTSMKFFLTVPETFIAMSSLHYSSFSYPFCRGSRSFHSRRNMYSRGTHLISEWGPILYRPVSGCETSYCADREAYKEFDLTLCSKLGDGIRGNAHYRSWKVLFGWLVGVFLRTFYFANDLFKWILLFPRYFSHFHSSDICCFLGIRSKVSALSCKFL
jgi:hypothetical protein